MAAALLGTVALVSVVSPAQPPTQTVVIASREIPAGQTITTDHLRTVQLPEADLPDGHITDPALTIGKMAIATIPVKAVVTKHGVFTAGELNAADGKAIMPLRLAEEGLQDLLRVGAHIDLIGFGSANGEAKVIATQIRIAAIPLDTQSTGFGSTAEKGTLVLVEVTPDEAAVITTATLSSKLSVILR